MRGELGCVHRSSLGWGITPAYAGRTTPLPPCTCLSADHPRVCGENPFWDSLVLDYEGSPPRMRGELEQVKLFNYLRGITPAYAGRTLGCYLQGYCR